MSFRLLSIYISVTNKQIWEGNKLGVQSDNFLLEGKETKIYSGAVHYFRSLPEQWEDILQKLKLAGFNTVETYMCWNLHEPEPGKFCFEGNLDICRFLDIAKRLGLYAILRPGPYICAEWDMGGLPAWLLKDKNMRIRCMHEPYLEHVKRYLTKTMELLDAYQLSNGGNVIAMQIENEYGHYGSDHTYLRYLKELMESLGCKELLFTSDGKNKVALAGGTLPDVFKTLNFGSGAKHAFQTLEHVPHSGPNMCMEFWCGWFDSWGKKHHTRKPEDVIKEIRDFLDMGASFNMYMFHGGTNFGFMAGANHIIHFTPTTTSYDYHAVLTESGDYTPVYHQLRKVMLEHQGLKETPLPPSPTYIHVGPVELTEYASLLDQLPAIGTHHQSPMPESMEYYGQSRGYIHYRTSIDGDWGNAMLLLQDLHDYCYVFRNGIFVKKVTPKKFKLVHLLTDCEGVWLKDLKQGETLDLFVDAMGHVNFGDRIVERKGISDVRLIGKMQTRSLMNFDVYTLPMDDLSNLTFDQEKTSLPGFLKGSFETEKPGHCYVKLTGFTKGCVWINGFHLGRYWNIGPQQTLYVPESILKQKNEIIVFEQESYKVPSVEIINHPVWGKK